MPFELLLALIKAVVWVGGWSQLVGMPIAWLRVRRSPAWKERPRFARGIDVLAELLLRPTVVAIGLAWLALSVIAIGDLDLPAVVSAALIFGPAILLVPVSAARVDPERIGSIVEKRFARPADPAL
jgi:hypothetical protein